MAVSHFAITAVPPLWTYSFSHGRPVPFTPRGLPRLQRLARSRRARLTSNSGRPLNGCQQATVIGRCGYITGSTPSQLPHASHRVERRLSTRQQHCSSSHSIAQRHTYLSSRTSLFVIPYHSAKSLTYVYIPCCSTPHDSYFQTSK